MPRFNSFKEAIDHYAFPEPMSGCWIWNKSTYNKGYGSITVKGEMTRAHRASAFVYGLMDSLKNELSVCHKCDNPSCVNPQHLFVATHQENINDCKKKNRLASGERAGLAKLNDNDYPDILYLYSIGVSVDEIAKKWSVSKCSISSMLLGKTFKYLGSSIKKRRFNLFKCNELNISGDSKFLSEKLSISRYMIYVSANKGGKRVKGYTFSRI